jgi:hypothetical protein
MRRYGLRDDQWDRIKGLLPGREGHVGVTAKDNRLFVEAVLYRYRAGMPWRDLPERFGDPIKDPHAIFALGQDRSVEEDIRDFGSGFRQRIRHDRQYDRSCPSTQCRRPNEVPSVSGWLVPSGRLLRKSTKRVLSGWSDSPYR